MKKYGFGPKFIKCFDDLYNNASSKIMINGHLSEKVDIKRGFKQGDASSNGFFNLAIDPLIRNMTMSREIEMINIRTPKSLEQVPIKAGAYADDVHTICKADQESVQGKCWWCC